MNNIISTFSQALLQALNHRYFLLYCFVVYASLRAILIFFLPVTPTSDAAWYFNQAISISEGNGYLRNGEPTAYWPIGYSAILSLAFSVFGATILTGQLLNLAVACIGFFVFLILARFISSNEQIARLCVLIIAIYPNNIAFTSLIMSETIFTTLLLLGCLVYIRYNSYGWVIIGGIIFGLATLVKTQTLLIPALLILFSFVFIKTRRWSLQTILKGMVLYLCLLLTILPWSFRNYMAFDEFVLVSTNSGMSLLAGNNPGMRADYKKDFNEDDPLVKSMGHPYGNEIEINNKAKQAAIDWITNNPSEFLALIPHKQFRLWAPDGEAEWAYQSMPYYENHETAFRTVRILNQIYYFAILVTAFLCLILVLRKKISLNNWVWIGLILALYTSLISIVFSGQSRYHFPVMPFIILYSSYFIHYIALKLSISKKEGRQ